MEASGRSLYPAQEEAVLELLADHHVVLNTPTGSGKSLVALALHYQALAAGRSSWYVSPIKALVNEKFFALCEAFGAERVGLMTGDATINREAPVVCCTAEILMNAALRGETGIDEVVLDEFHYYADRDRGVAWHLPLIALPEARFLLMSATLGNTAPIEERLAAFTGREVAVVRSHERPVPLSFEYRETPLHETIAELLERDEAPIYLVSFTQRAAAERAQDLTSVDLLSKDEKRAVAGAIGDFAFDTPHGKDLRRYLRAGIGLHHGGLIPKYRRLVERLAQAGLLKVISGTDTLGVGVNIPIRTVLLHQLCKYDGEKTRLLSVREFRQVAGRAGRKGFDDHGRVVVQAPEHVIENRRLDAKIAARPELKKKRPKKKPPERGFVNWDKSTFEQLTTRPPEPLEPVFNVTHGMLVEVLQSDPGSKDGGYRRLLELLGRAHVRDPERRRLKRVAAQRFRSLRHAGIIDVQPGPKVAVTDTLQADFSIHHTLALWLLDALGHLDPDAPSYALDLLSLVEAMLETPMVILRAQVSKLKGEKVAELKAAGVDYEDRMAELQKIDHPKPLAELVYASFDAFEARHPWISGEHLKPKSIAREMVEQATGFNDYVRAYGLARSEGVLLRYLGDAYKTLLRTVPESFRSEELGDILVWLRQTIAAVDASLLAEWEAMRDGTAVVRRDAEAPPPPLPPDLAADPKALAARVRVECHAVVRRLADRDYAGALAALEGEGFTAADLEAAMAPFFEAHAAVDLTPRARLANNTVLTALGPRQYEVQHRILDPEGDDDWALRARLEVPPPGEDAGPLLELLGIGT